MDSSPTRHFAYDMDISPIHDISPPITLLDRLVMVVSAKI